MKNENVTAAAQTQFDNMTVSAQHVLNLANSILDFHNIDSERVILSNAPFSPAQLTDELFAAALPLCEAKNITLTNDTTIERNLILLGDVVRLRQATDNILSNAIKFTPKGKTISLHSAFDGENLSISVSDQGGGIPEDKRQRIFDEFTRLDNAADSAGFGLGLSITARLIEMMRGAIDLSSVVGEGSVFTLTIPLGVAPDVQNDAAEQCGEKVDNSVTANLNCLIVDDDTVQLDYLRMLLGSASIRATVAHNAHEAVELFLNDKFDFILSDIHLSDSDGYDILKAIRTSNAPNAGNIPIIAVSAGKGEDDAYYTDKGFAAFVRKPFTKEQLLEIVCSLFHRETASGEHPAFEALTAYSANDDEAEAILQSFAAETRKNILSLQAALADNDRVAAAKTAHKMSPIFGLLGCNILCANLEILEQNLSDTTTEEWSAIVNKVISGAQTVLRQMESKE
jgi:CheY-like chemotaxis protein/anti-sigma regulatory factor (Ser/Thr protein kinase)